MKTLQASFLLTWLVGGAAFAAESGLQDAARAYFQAAKHGKIGLVRAHLPPQSLDQAADFGEALEKLKPLYADAEIQSIDVQEKNGLGEVRYRLRHKTKNRVEVSEAIFFRRDAKGVWRLHGFHED